MGFSDADEAPVRRYFSLPPVQDKGDEVSARILILDETPLGVWQHRINNRPVNCPGERAGCPACYERKAIQITGDESYKALYRMSKRWRTNVLLVDKNEVKLLDFSGDLLKKLGAWEKRLDEKTKKAREKKPDAPAYTLQNQVFIYTKTKSGDRRQDVDYDLMPDDSLYELTDEQRALIEEKFPLEPEVQPATVEFITELIGKEKNGDSSPSSESPEPVAAATSTPLPAGNTIEALTAAAARKNLDLEDILEPGEKPEELDEARIKKLLALLS